MVILQIWGQWDVSKEDVIQFLACPSKAPTYNCPCSFTEPTCRLPVEEGRSHAGGNLSPGITDRAELPADQKHQPGFAGGENFFGIKPLRFQGLSGSQGNTPSIPLTNKIGIVYTKASS